MSKGYAFAHDAVKEAVFNALIHCNGADTVLAQIRIEDDVIFISNRSMLSFGWTAETLLGSQSVVNSIMYNIVDAHNWAPAINCTKRKKWCKIGVNRAK